jgi:hypothetical protein
MKLLIQEAFKGFSKHGSGGVLNNRKEVTKDVYSKKKKTGNE